MATADPVRVWDCGFGERPSVVVTAASDATLRLWDLETPAEPVCFEDHANTVYACDLAHQQNIAVSGSRDRTVKVWDVVAQQSKLTFFGHTAKVHVVQLSQSSEFVLSGSWDSTCRLWSRTRQSEVQMFQHHEAINTCTISGDNSLVASSDHVARVWDTETRALLFISKQLNLAIFGCSLSNDGTTLATCANDGCVRLIDTRSGEHTVLKRHIGSAYFCTFTPDMRHVVSCGETGTIIVWDCATGLASKTFSGFPGAARRCRVSHDGSHLLSCSPTHMSVVLWNIESGCAVAKLEEHTAWHEVKPIGTQERAPLPTRRRNVINCFRQRSQS